MSIPERAAESEEALRRGIARLLEVGTWLASLVIAAGILLAKKPLVVAGIGLFIALPVARLLVMLVVFLRGGERRLAIIAAVVIVIIALGGA